MPEQFLIVDSTTGTILQGTSCYILRDSDLSEEDLDIMECGSDWEIGGMAQRKGTPVRLPGDPGDSAPSPLAPGAQDQPPVP
ncbi:hypothetical protein SCBWM1_gp65 [Synechococcus phage S-CBWM1]|uniref:Uncharacterized protein n=1 Tax=Synechococcus phage S-CBWM1 TaxID=2053653 RepID=A0A3G1L3J8_9CAUD|nr:hypothetical protein HOU61_gp132 [Synechococcus phage S-CBWM1]ATW62749.1 hypothetical protein SCBWM1_gp65 [Synechococcus phage S-CBWM1]